MDKLVSLKQKTVRIFKTEEGAIGIVATCIPMKAIDGLAEKLQKRLDARENKALANQDKKGGPGRAT